MRRESFRAQGVVSSDNWSRPGWLGRVFNIVRTGPRTLPAGTLHQWSRMDPAGSRYTIETWPKSGGWCVVLYDAGKAVRASGPYATIELAEVAWSMLAGEAP